jgi:hypothetical protein
MRIIVGSTRPWSIHSGTAQQKGRM